MIPALLAAFGLGSAGWIFVQTRVAAGIQRLLSEEGRGDSQRSLTPTWTLNVVGVVLGVVGVVGCLGLLAVVDDEALLAQWGEVWLGVGALLGVVVIGLAFLWASLLRSIAARRR